MHEGMLCVIGGIGAALWVSPFNNVDKVYYVKCISGVRKGERDPAPLIGRVYRDFRIVRQGLSVQKQGLLSTFPSAKHISGDIMMSHGFLGRGIL